MELDSASRILSLWAGEKPQIRRLWIFGSRLKGTSTEGSDIDIAIELVYAKTWEVDLVDLWFKYDDPWTSELERLLPWKIDLEFFDPEGTTPSLASYLQENSRLVYENAS